MYNTGLPKPKTAAEMQPRCVVGQKPLIPTRPSTSSMGAPPGSLGMQAGSPTPQGSNFGVRVVRPAGPGGTSRGPMVKGTINGMGADENHAVVTFLKEIGLEQYAMTLLQSGFDDMETLLAIEDNDMKDLGIPAFSIVRLRRRLQELQRQAAQAGGPDCGDGHPVAVFLEESGLGQYAKPLIRSGFDDMETLLDIEDTDMKDLGIPRGHALKLKKRLREYQLQLYAHEEPHMHVVAHHQVIQVRTPQRKSGQVPAATMRQMPSEQMKSAVEQSWEQVQALGTYTVAEILYRHTFEIMPEAVHIFPTHVRMKYREWSADEGCDESNVFESPALRKLFSKFVNAVGCAVAGLHDSSKLVPMLTQLGARHINYGVNESHFQAMGRALAMTLRDILCESYTSEVEGAWSMAYSFMSCIMIEGLKGALAARETAIVGKALQQEAENVSEHSTFDGLGSLSELADTHERQETLESAVSGGDGGGL